MTIVYRGDVSQLIDPIGMVRHSWGTEVELSDVLRSIQASYPEHGIQRLVFPGKADATYFIHLLTAQGENFYASIDPGNAKILRAGSIWEFPTEAAAMIHYDLMMGASGHVYISLMGAFGLFMVTTGLLQWWPRTGLRLRQAGIHRGAPKKPVFRRLHRSIGVAMSAFIYFSLATGLTLSLIFFLDSLTAIPVPPAAAPSEIGPLIDQAIVRARAEFPTHEIRDVRFAGAGRSNIFFRAVESNPRAFHLVGINLPDLDIAVKLDADRNTSSWVTIYPLHTGESFGTVGRVLVLLNGLSISLLATSGPIMWLQRHRRRSVRTTRDSARQI